MQIKELLVTPIRIAQKCDDTQEDLNEKLNRISDSLDLLTKHIVLRQDAACELVGITPETIRSHERAENIQAFSCPGSRQVFYTLESLIELRPKIRGTKRSTTRKRR